jgi:hypothetical protein
LEGYGGLKGTVRRLTMSDPKALENYQPRTLETGS